MKRTILIVLMTLVIVTFAQAQNRDRQGQGQGGAPAPREREARTPPQAITVTGNLTIAQGMIAVNAGDITYLTPSLNRYVGFIDTLKDGAQVKLEGFAAPNRRNAESKVTFFMPTKMNIGGKDYDLGRPQMNMGMMQPRQNFRGQQGWQNGRQHGWQGKNYGGRDSRHHQGNGKNTPQGRGPRR